MQPTRKVVNLSAVRQANSRLASKSKPKILFVDDEERILNTMRALFRRQYQVTTTTDGYHALKLLEQEHFQLLVSDQRMPIMPGVELLREAKRVSPDTVRILLTGFSDLAAIIGSVNEGEVFRFLNKPWDNQEFIATVAEAVEVGLDLEAAAKPAAIALEPVEPEPVAPTPKGREVAQARHIELVATSPAVTEQAGAHRDDSVIVLNGDQTLQDSVQAMLPDCQILIANSYDETLDLMMQREVGVIIVNIISDYDSTLAFFSLLKVEHPQVVSVILADSGDSTAIVQLINHARIYRYMFKPLRPRLMQRYLHSALAQYQQFKLRPTLLKQQKVYNNPLSGISKAHVGPDTGEPRPDQRPEATAHVATHDAAGQHGQHNQHNQHNPAAENQPNKTNDNLMQKMKKLRSFFSRLITR